MKGRCNVIKRILIPKLKKTIVYILSELEEREREETFRIKQFKKLKDKRTNKGKKEVHVCSCCLAMLEKDKDANILCKTCRELDNISHQMIYTEPCSYEDKDVDDMMNRLELLKEHIAEVISLGQICTQEGLVSESMERFIQTCCAVQEKLEDEYNSQPVCDVCMQKMQKSDRLEIPGSVTPKSGKSDTTVVSTDSIYNLGSESVHKLGYFEKKFKEIVKVTRQKNDDGTVTEKKQVITIKTEKRNPKKSGAGSCTGINSGPYLGPGGYDGDSANNFRLPRNTKSERTCQSNKMGEQKVRKCMSSGFQKPERDASTNFDASSCCSTKSSQSNYSKTSSHACGSRSGSKPASQVSSQTSSKSCSSSTHSSKGILGQKPTQQCHPCCLTSCHGDAVELKKSEGGKTVGFVTTGTDALWRDEATSTTELNIEPSRFPGTTQSTASCRTNCGTESKTPPQSTEKPMIKCRIKILPKASDAEQDKICYPAPPNVEYTPNANPEQQIVIRGSLIDILKSIVLPRQTESASTKVAFTEPDKPKLVCKSCISKLSSYVANQDLDETSVHSNTSSCKICQASISNDQEVASGSISAVSPSLSCKSLGIGSSSSQVKCCPPQPKCNEPMKKPACAVEPPKMHVKPHKCCIDKSTDSKDPSCCTLAAKLTAKKSSKSCKCTPSSTSQKTIEPPPKKCAEMKDAQTSTKRSDKFDVRCIKHLPSCSKKPSSNMNDCSCQSEPYLCSDRSKNPLFRKSKSCQDNNNKYYKQ